MKIMQRVIVGVFGIMVSSVPAVAQDRGWVDVNIGAAVSAAGEQVFSFTERLYSEPHTTSAAYVKPNRGGSFDFGGGFMVNPVVGFGVSFAGTAHETAAGLATTIAHPFFFNASTTAAGHTDEPLTRSEGAAHLQVMVASNPTPRLRVRFFGGPSYFRYKADHVSDLNITQLAFAFSRVNLVTIEDFESQNAEGTGWGFNAGSDVSFFFTKVVGIGAFGRYAMGSVTVNDEPMSETVQDIDVGGFQFGGGLRLRF